MTLPVIGACRDDGSPQGATEAGDPGDGSDADRSLSLSHWRGDMYDQWTPVLTGKTSIELEQQKVPWGDYLQKLTTSLVSGTAPDIIQVDSLWQVFFRTNTLTPIDLGALESAGIDMSKWSVDPARGAGGGIFGIPTFTAQDIILLASVSSRCCDLVDTDVAAGAELGEGFRARR